jgi:Trk K+ transport system NAD-binding subunit
LITIDDDLTNSIIAEKAKELNPRIRIVARVFRDELARMLKSSGDVDVAISTTLATSQLFLAGAQYDVELTIPPIAPVKVERDSEMNGKSIKELEDLGISVIGLLVEGKWAVPPRDHIVKQGDVLLLQL